MGLVRRFGWAVAGVGVAVLIAAGIGTERAWVLMLGYAVFNLIGTAHALRLNREPGEHAAPPDTRRERFFRQRLPVILKSSFVAQLPLGLAILMLEGL